MADYIAINISSPNTPSLRELQEPDALRALLTELMNVREQLGPIHGKRVPMLVKIAPDFERHRLEQVMQQLEELRIDGVIATNTTVHRPGSLRSRYAHESGGLSGRPLHASSVRIIRTLREGLGPQFPIIGVGGIVSVQHGGETLDAGANLLALYTGLIYQGPRLIQDLLSLG